MASSGTRLLTLTPADRRTSSHEAAIDCRSSISKGLAVWVENRLGPGNLDLHQTVSTRGWHRVFPVKRTILEFDYYNARGTRSMHYAVAGSFVQFLIDEVLGGDIAGFQRFYRRHQNNYAKHFGKSFGQLADAWAAFVEAMAAS